MLGVKRLQRGVRRCARRSGGKRQRARRILAPALGETVWTCTPGIERALVRVLGVLR